MIDSGVLTISLGTSSFQVSKAAISRNSTLFLYRPDISGPYLVQNHVLPEILDQFLHGMENPAEISITPKNLSDLSLLSEEFGVLELTARCNSFSSCMAAISNSQNYDEQIEAISTRIGTLEETVLLSVTESTNLKNEILQLRRDCDRLKTLEESITLLRADLNAAKERLSHSSVKVKCPLKEGKPLDGIISYLTRKHGGNVHNKGIVTITSKSALSNSGVRNIADLTAASFFRSKDEPSQWVLWDFQERRARPAAYTIKADQLKSWTLEGSLDGESWNSLDRKIDTKDLKGQTKVASFHISNASEYRFLRLTQTDKNHDGSNMLALYSVEFFGAIFE
jgi:hypothetical protein